MFFAIKATQLTDGLPARVLSKVGECKWARIVDTYKRTTEAGANWEHQIFSDILVGVDSLRLADHLVEAGAPVWSYRFDYAEADPCGLCHGSDLAYTFTLGQPGKGRGSFTAAEQQLSDRMRDGFIAFARTGDPQTTAIPEWPLHAPSEPQYLKFDTTIAVANYYLGSERRAAWQSVPLTAL